MNNVWTAIAFKGPCVARQSARKPLLELFNGYARYISRRSGVPASSSRVIRRTTLSIPCEHTTHCSSHGFATSAIVLARKRQTNRIQQSRHNESKLEPAQTVASHTEGLSPLDNQLTWRDYDPAGGMPLPQGNFSQPEINGTFNTEEVDAETGNYILNVMYWRRMSGALIDTGLDFPQDSGVSRDQALKGLEYVRKLHPDFDEQAAGDVWAEEESLRLQEQLRDKAVKLRLYKEDESQAEADAEQMDEASDQGTQYGRERNQDSSLLRLREENIAWLEKDKAERQAKQEAEELSAIRAHRGPLELGGGIQPPMGVMRYTPGGVTISQPQTKAWLQPVERKPWVKYYENQAEIIKENYIPQMSLLRRVGPSLLVTLAIVGLALYTAENYTPPSRAARLFPDTKPAVATLAGLTTALTFFFILSRFPPLWRTYSKYFTLVPAYPYAISILGSTFRHQPVTHLLTNVASLWLFGLLLHEDVGRGTFLAIFFGSGAIGAFTSLTYNVLRQNWMAYMFGSSGCVIGVVAAACTLRPNGTIQITGYDVPLAAWMFLALYGGAQTMAAFKGLQPSIDHAGHLGGLIAGLASAVLVRRGVRDKNIDKERVDGLMG